VNPMGKIPALVDGKLPALGIQRDQLVRGGEAPQSRLLPPSIEGRASVQRWLFFQAAHVDAGLHPRVPRDQRARAGVLEDERRSPGCRGCRKELARYLP